MSSRRVGIAVGSANEHDEQAAIQVRQTSDHRYALLLVSPRSTFSTITGFRSPHFPHYHARIHHEPQTHTMFIQTKTIYSCLLPARNWAKSKLLCLVFAPNIVLSPTLVRSSDPLGPSMSVARRLACIVSRTLSAIPIVLAPFIHIRTQTGR